MAFASFFKRDGKGILTKAGVINQVSEVLGQVVVLNAVVTALAI